MCAECCSQWESASSSAEGGGGGGGGGGVAARQPCQCPVCRRKFVAGGYTARWSRWAVADAGDGTYQCSYASAPDGGAALLEVRVGGAHVRGSPFAVECKANESLFTRAGSNVTLSEGGTVATKTGASSWTNAVAVLGRQPLTAGVHSWELVVGGRGSGMVGVCKASVNVESGTSSVYSTYDAWFLYCNNGALFGQGKSHEAPAGAITVGDRVGMRLDLSAGTLTFTKART